MTKVRGHVNCRSYMNQQYGNHPPASAIPGWLAMLIRQFGIERNQFVSQLMTPGKRLLDAGCGDGTLCYLCAKKFDQIIGIDVSDERIQRLIENKNFSANCEFKISDLNSALPFDNQYFDCITALETLDWVYDLNGCLSEFNRILTKTGTLILQVNNLGFVYRRLLLMAGIYPKISAFRESEWARIGWDAGVCHMFTQAVLSRCLKQFGFQIQKVTGTGIFYPLRNWWPSFLCGDLIFVCRKP